WRETPDERAPLPLPPAYVWQPHELNCRLRSNRKSGELLAYGCSPPNAGGSVQCKQLHAHHTCRDKKRCRRRKRSTLRHAQSTAASLRRSGPGIDPPDFLESWLSLPYPCSPSAS